jgi:dolichyl-phosphate-mannose--protein O-mannosyl transferase
MSINWLIKFLERNYLFVILAILAFTIHFAFLSYPSQTVFDEVYFGKFSAAYFNHEYYFDIHPPLGKLIIAAWAWITNFDLVFNYDKIGTAANPELFFTLRFLPAFFGSLFVLLFSWFAYLATQSKRIALIAGILILFDNAFLVQTKITAIDVFLLFFEILTFSLFLLYQKEKSFSKKWFICLALTGISFGLAISIKWTGLAAIGIIGIVLFFKIFSARTTKWLSPNNNSAGKITKLKEAIVSALVISAIGFLVYLVPFYAHFDLLDKSGPGDAFMSTEFQSELKNGRKNTPNPLSFWEKFTELNGAMYRYNTGLTATHPYGSTWNQWPFDKKPIWYWYQDALPGNSEKVGKIYFLGNPIIWWLALGAITLTIFRLVSQKERREITPFMYFLILAYFANLLPFIGIKRVAFLYHYLLSISFAILILSIYLEKIWQKDKAIFAALMFFIAISFMIIAPLSYGWLMSPAIDRFEIKIIDFLS